MNTSNFSYRHIGPRKEDEEKMLDTIGVKTIEELIDKTVPSQIRLKKDLNIPKAFTEYEFMQHIKALGDKNKIYKSYIGLGYYNTILPGVIQRNILENPGWYTAYTPYQAEIAQGRLKALLNFQTAVVELTGMEIANASLLDESTAAAEAMIMLYNNRSKVKKKYKSHKFFVSDRIFPQTIDVLQTRSTPLGIELVISNVEDFDFSSEYYGVILQYPALGGEAKDYAAFVERAHQNEISVAVATDIMSLALLTPPGQWGTDVVVGTTQRFGVPLSYGGPHAAFFATLEKYKRSIPGRIIGKSKDKYGNTALRMALQTREQHIKREKATSNICTSQVLLAVMAGMYAVYHGAQGLKNIAIKIHNLTYTLHQGIEKLGFKVLYSTYFDTIAIDLGENLYPTGESIQPVKRIAEEEKVNFYYMNQNTISISLDETTSLQDVNHILSILAKAKGQKAISFDKILESNIIVGDLKRTSSFLKDEVFKKYHSETEMMRYIKRLERKDLSLNHSMIPLGSCTMKLNAATEMLPLSWLNWTNIHPFVPIYQAKGYQEMFRNLEKYLSEITGFAATSLQPNSGAQGEYTGLMVIRAYHQNKGQNQRKVVLIPASAHGTNPASAIMAGMKVVVTKCDDKGNIDLEDLKTKAREYRDTLSALMVTYPSTHGVYEEQIKEVTRMIHAYGGQVYMDGANMNAQVGITNPYNIGADVCHLNLHKTFAIPHGGGGPGVGPICVAKHLVPFLPSNPVIPSGGKDAITAISAAPWGSSLVDIISYGYIVMNGAKGLLKSTQIAILSANYIKTRLKDNYEILYTGDNGTIAHEMIVDCRAYKKYGIEVVDIAKRLMDYGFHAPTVSFPVVGTLMIEPTESESLQELDRFVEAMLSIKREIEQVIRQEIDLEDSTLKNAPHTLAVITADNWNFKYTRKQAAYPLEWIRENKFWPAVARIDDAYGDRNLVCTCESIENYS